MAFISSKFNLSGETESCRTKLSAYVDEAVVEMQANEAGGNGVVRSKRRGHRAFHRCLSGCTPSSIEPHLKSRTSQVTIPAQNMQQHRSHHQYTCSRMCHPSRKPRLMSSQITASSINESTRYINALRRSLLPKPC